MIEYSPTVSSLIKDSVFLAYNLEAPRDYIGISSIGFCNKKLWNHWTTKTKPNLDPQTTARFFRGHALHDFLPHVLWKHRGKLPFKYVKSEKEISIDLGDGRTLKGHADIIVEIGGVEMVGDWKFVDYVDKITEPHAHNVDQIMVYAWALGYKKCFLDYTDSSTMASVAFVIDVDEDRVAGLLKKYSTLMDCIDSKQEPEAAYSDPGETWECRYCDFKTRCWGESNEGLYTKKDGSVEIPEDLGSEYLKAKQGLDYHQDLVDTAKEKISKYLDGKKGFYKNLSAGIVERKPSIKLNEDELKLLIAESPHKNEFNELIHQATEVKPGSSSYVLRVKNEAINE